MEVRTWARSSPGLGAVVLGFLSEEATCSSPQGAERTESGSCPHSRAVWTHKTVDSLPSCRFINRGVERSPCLRLLLPWVTDLSHSHGSQSGKEK